ncbi:hypothetical protein H8R12_00950 [Morganella morganii]|uniref:hypothetical protein n=1 Tax=Morganella morganii TaxID=582 RepID=UPI001648F642|nr:hypothetical protein [Morganella morganii]EMD6373779.1 hypothetical protein [Morganella morganii]MBC3974416.1 hypothetical protein [Morganella morganii]MBT0384756.1 hypothetical protein [Morganella morganii subsp. morganii]
MRIARTNEFTLIAYLKSPPYHAVEKPIDYGVQFELASGVICNFHYKEKTPDEFSFTVQRHSANPEQAKMIEHFASGIAL